MYKGATAAWERLKGRFDISGNPRHERPARYPWYYRCQDEKCNRVIYTQRSADDRPPAWVRQRHTCDACAAARGEKDRRAYSDTPPLLAVEIEHLSAVRVRITWVCPHCQTPHIKPWVIDPAQMTDEGIRQDIRATLPCTTQCRAAR